MKQFLKKLALCAATLVLLCCFTPMAFAASYYVTIDLEPQGGVGVATQTYAYKGIWSGYRLTSIPEPTLEGYTFEGWYDDMVGGTKVTTSYSFTKDTTIYAHWVPDVKTQTEGSAEQPKDDSFQLQDHLGTILVVAGVAVVVVAVVAAQSAQ